MPTPRADTAIIASGADLWAGRDAPSRRITLWGQSNALGLGARSGISSAPLSSDSGLADFDANPFARVYIWRSSAGEYQPLENGVNQQANTTSDIGPEFGLAVRWMRTTGSGLLFIDKATASGTAIALFRDGQTFFENQQTQLALQNAWLTANGHSPINSGLLWVQGESDYLSSEATYRSQLNALMSEAEAAGFLSASTLRVLAQVNAANTHYGAGVAAAKSTYVSDNPSISALVTYSDYMNGDNLHLNAAGVTQLGYDAAVHLFGAAAVEV